MKEKEQFVEQAWILWKLTEKRRQGELGRAERIALRKALNFL